MAKKLVFDRTLWITAKSGFKITVPEDEVWKLGSADYETIKESSFNSASDRIIGGGSKITASAEACFSGIAFKIVEE